MRIRYRDLAARVFTDEITYPTFFPSMYSGSAPATEGILVNVYHIWTDREFRKVINKSIHKHLSYDGFVLPESGWKQIDKYGDDEVTNEDIVEIQVKMEFPIIAPLPSSRVEDAIINAKLARSQSDKPLFLEIPNAWTEREIFAFAEATKDWAWGYGTHSEDPAFLERILKVVPRSKKIVVFGIHHPATIPVLVSMGVDVLSSGAHERYASKKLYITESSIRPLHTLNELPCSCKICSERESSDLIRNTELLAEHNLLSFIEEVRRTRNAIVEGRLYEYAKRRALTHPDLYQKFLKIVNGSWILENLPFPKQNSIYIFENEHRPELELGKKKAKKNGVELRGLAYTYPFGQTYPPIMEERPEPELVVKSIFKYQFGIEIDPSELRWELRRGIPRKIYLEDKYLGLIRFEDGFFVPSIEGAKWLAERLPSPRLRIVLDKDGVEAIRLNRSPLTDHVLDVDTELRPNMEIILTDENDEVIATGKSILTAREVAEIPRTIVAKIRHRAR